MVQKQGDDLTLACTQALVGLACTQGWDSASLILYRCKGSNLSSREMRSCTAVEKVLAVGGD